MPKGKGASGSNREAKVPMRRRGAHCLVVVMKRGNARGAKGQVIAVEHGPTGSNWEEPEGRRKAAAFVR